MQAIETSYMGPTNTRQARVRACWANTARNRSGRRVYTNWADEYDTDQNHAIAARLLAEQSGYDFSAFERAEGRDGAMVWVMVRKETARAVLRATRRQPKASPSLTLAALLDWMIDGDSNAHAQASIETTLGVTLEREQVARALDEHRLTGGGRAYSWVLDRAGFAWLLPRDGEEAQEVVRGNMSDGETMLLEWLRENA